MSIRREDIYTIDLSEFMKEGTPDAVPTHPGYILREILEEQEISARQLARDLGVPVTRITEILHEQRAVTADTAVRLGRHFKTSAEMWLNLQMGYDLHHARQALGVAA